MQGLGEDSSTAWDPPNQGSTHFLSRISLSLVIRDHMKSEACRQAGTLFCLTGHLNKRTSKGW